MKILYPNKYGKILEEITNIQNIGIIWEVWRILFFCH